MKSLDSNQIQRLIDGELEHAQLQQLLTDANSDAEAWKTIATGFIENQMFASQFNAIEQEDTSQHDPQIRNQSDSVAMPRYWMLSLAASALLTLSIGMLIGSGFFKSNNNGNNLPLANAGNSIVENQGAEKSSNSPAMYQMQLEDGNGNRFNTDIPFYKVANWNDVDRHQFKDYSTDVRDRVLNSGYDLQHNTRYLQGRLNDGRRFVIPVRNTKFSPYQ